MTAGGGARLLRVHGAKTALQRRPWPRRRRIPRERPAARPSRRCMYVPGQFTYFDLIGSRNGTIRLGPGSRREIFPWAPAKERTAGRAAPRRMEREAGATRRQSTYWLRLLDLAAVLLGLRTLLLALCLRARASCGRGDVERVRMPARW